MKRISAFCLFVFLTVLNVFAEQKHFVAEETYIAYYPSDNYLQVVEYNLLHVKGTGALKSDTEDFKKRIEKSEAAPLRFGLENFYSVEEKLYNSESFITAQYDFLTYKQSSLKLIEEVFSKVLERNVNVEVIDGKIRLIFDGTGIKLGSRNCEEALQKNNLCCLVWSNKLRSMELVFSRETVNTESILPFVEESICSPEKTSEEIEFLRYGLPELTGDEKEYQDNCDIVRLKHLSYYGKLIEEYKEKTGHYPFQNNIGGQTYAFIYNKKQKKYARDTNPEKHRQIPPKTFFDELENGLGHKIDQLYDPQYVPTDRPVFYVYMIEGDTFYFAVHLSKYYTFSKRVADHYYKVEISSRSVPEFKIWSLKDILANEKFSSAVSGTIKNEGYFVDREEKHRQEY